MNKKDKTPREFRNNSWAMKENDLVNKPAHYQGKVECIDAIETAVEGLEGLEAVCTANVIKYVWRWKKKNGREDLAKAEWYLKKLLSLQESDRELS